MEYLLLLGRGFGRPDEVIFSNPLFVLREEAQIYIGTSLLKLGVVVGLTCFVSIALHMLSLFFYSLFMIKLGWKARLLLLTACLIFLFFPILSFLLFFGLIFFML